MKRDSQASTIDDELKDIRLLDTHEHIVPEDFRLSLKLDFTYLLANYLGNDLTSAGMSGDEIAAVSTPGRKISEYLNVHAHHHRRPLGYPYTERLPSDELSLDEKWRRIKPYWERARNTGHARCILIAIRDLFGIEDINQSTYQAISEALQASNQIGWYHSVLKERAGIELSVNDIGTTNLDREFFRPSIRFDRFADVHNHNDLNRLQYDTDTSIHSLNKLVQALEEDFSQKLESGLLAVKIGLAYQRKLYFSNATHHEAEKALNRLFRHSREELSWEETMPLQDYMIHKIVRLAAESFIPIQVHTGMHGGGGNVINNSDPALLTNLFIQYPSAKFDVFHAGYPFHSKLAVLAKNFPNVYADMCWVYMLSPYMADRILHEWLDLIPVGKILGFGGDHLIVEGAYGHSRMARSVVCRVLKRKVEDGDFTEDEAIKYGRMILHDNAKELFGI